MEYTEEEIKEYWYDFFSHTDYGIRLSEIRDEYPDTRSIYVSFLDMEEYNPTFAEDFLKNPDVYLPLGEDAIKEFLDEDMDIHLRVNQLPRDRRREIRDLRSVHLGQFIGIDGIIRVATEVRPRMKLAAFRCTGCGYMNYVEQEDFILHEPSACGNCGKKPPQVRFRLNLEESIFTDVQRVEIQETPENLRGGEQPQRLTAYLEDDLAGELVPAFPSLKCFLGFQIRSSRLDRF